MYTLFFTLEDEPLCEEDRPFVMGHAGEEPLDNFFLILCQYSSMLITKEQGDIS